MKILRCLPEAVVEYEFLKAEWYKDGFNPVREKYNEIVVAGDLKNDEQNRIRKWLLWKARFIILRGIPSDTVWSLCEIDADQFCELRIIREIKWENTFRTAKKLKDVAAKVQEGVTDIRIDLGLIEKIKQNIGKYDFKEKLICISSGLDGPFTLIEGNHRAVAFQLKYLETGDKSHLPKEVIAGISPKMKISPWFNMG